VAGQNPDLPIVVYNVPSRTAVDIAPETIARLRRGSATSRVKETTREQKMIKKTKNIQHNRN